jgi:hypothetical protein
MSLLDAIRNQYPVGFDPQTMDWSNMSTARLGFLDNPEKYMVFMRKDETGNVQDYRLFDMEGGSNVSRLMVWDMESSCEEYHEKIREKLEKEEAAAEEAKWKKELAAMEKKDAARDKRIHCYSDFKRECKKDPEFAARATWVHSSCSEWHTLCLDEKTEETKDSPPPIWWTIYALFMEILGRTRPVYQPPQAQIEEIKA